jgi:hypothetical protein
VSHSLGARVLFETAKRLRADYTIGQLCTMAAAVDDTSVSDPRDYRSAIARSRRVAVLSSRRDRVLSLAYPAGDLLQAFISFRTDRPGLALGFHGPRPTSGHAIPSLVYHEQIPDDRRSDHGHYQPPTPNQTSAMNFCTAVLLGVPHPRYV